MHLPQVQLIAQFLFSCTQPAVYTDTKYVRLGISHAYTNQCPTIFTYFKYEEFCSRHTGRRIFSFVIVINPHFLHIV